MHLSVNEEHILDLLRQHKMLSVGQIGQYLYVSQPSVRRYLASLEEKGQIIRTHGGAMLNISASDQTIPMMLRENSASLAKQAIAEKAATLIKDGDIVMMDASTTCRHIVPFLAKKNNIRVITSGLKTALLLCETNIKTISTGGNILAGSYSFIGQNAIASLKKYNADIAFFSCHGLSDTGLVTENSQEENAIREAMMAQSKKSVLLVDNTKFHQTCFFNLCSLSDIDVCCSDIPLPPPLGSKTENLF